MRRKWIVAGLLGISLLVQAEEIREIQTIDQLLQEEVIPIVEIQELEVKKIETKVPETEIPEKSDREKDRGE